MLTFILGGVFLGIKAIEYHEKWEKHHIPGIRYSVQSFVDPASDPEVYNEYHDKPLALDMARRAGFILRLLPVAGVRALRMMHRH